MTGQFSRRLAAIVLMLCGGYWCVVADASAASGCRLAFAGTLPLALTKDGQHLLVGIVANKQKLTMILDTGAEGIMLTRKAARAVNNTTAIGSLLPGTDEGQQGYDMGVGGAGIVNRLEIDDLELGHMHGAFDAHVGDVDFSTPGAPSDGLLGMSVLANFDIDLDIQGGQLGLYTTSGRCNTPAVALPEPIYALPMLPAFNSLVRIFVPVVVNGHTLRALLDSGASKVLIFAHAGAELGLSDAAGGAARTTMIRGVGGTSQAVSRRLDSMAVGPLTFRNTEAVIDSENSAEADMLLGLPFMKKVHVWLSNSSHQLVMQYPPAVSPPRASGGASGGN